MMRLCETGSKQCDVVKYKQLLCVDLPNPNGKVKSVTENAQGRDENKEKKQFYHVLQEK